MVSMMKTRLRLPEADNLILSQHLQMAFKAVSDPMQRSAIGIFEEMVAGIMIVLKPTGSLSSFFLKNSVAT